VRAAQRQARTADGAADPADGFAGGVVWRWWVTAIRRVFFIDPMYQCVDVLGPHSL